MANKNVFKSAAPGKTPPVADTINHAGGNAYSLTAKQALAQYAVTGTFNDTFYTSGSDQLQTVLKLCGEVEPLFVAKLAMYSRATGKMKDMPAVLCANLASRGEEGMALLKSIFPIVIDNGKMLRNFVQIIRSGVTGRKSFGTGLKKLIRSWFETKKPEEIFRMSMGNNPSLSDVIRMVHPRPENEEKRAIFGYIANVEPNKVRTVERTRVDRHKQTKETFQVNVKNYDPDKLPQIVKDYEAFKKAKAEGKETDELPKVPWEMLEGLSLSEKDWKALARQASWTQTRMNLNTFARHNVFLDKEITDVIVDKLKDPALIEKSRSFPYQLYTAYKNIGNEIPRNVVHALHDALEISTKNVTTYAGEMHVAVDVSGSMNSPVTGHRAGATTKATCVDVAALIASVFLRKNMECKVYPFDTTIRHDVKLEARDSIMTNASKISEACGGGTDCSKVLAHLNEKKAKGDLVVYISDTESWADAANYWMHNRVSGMQAEWEKYRARNPKAKLVCINLAVNTTSQVVTDKATLNIGGWSDAMFDIINEFVSGNSGSDHWVAAIEAVQLPVKS